MLTEPANAVPVEGNYEASGLISCAQSSTDTGKMSREIGSLFDRKFLSAWPAFVSF